jgi:hypothetical protein
LTIEKLPEVKSLTAKEKAILARELRVETGDVGVSVSGDEGHAQIINDRWQEFQDYPGNSTPWEDINLRIEQQIQDDKAQ